MEALSEVSSQFLSTYSVFHEIPSTRALGLVLGSTRGFTGASFLLLVLGNN
jgi:hypothetical protein